MKKQIKISVRNLVEFIMRSGSIDNRFNSTVKAIEGTRAHQKIQKSYKKENYTAEFPLKYEFDYDDIHIQIEGRADGILISENEITIDEIKTTTKDLLDISEDFNPLHWAQAKCYGFIYCKDNNLKEINIQLTYYNIDTMGIKYLKKSFTFEELKSFFFNLIDEYKYWAELEAFLEKKRNASLKNLEFPFEKYRNGQRDLAVRVYSSIVHGKKCFAQAPTGIGKTMSTLFPSIKAMGEGHTSKIFYLTAKTITREVAESSIFTLKKQNIFLSFVTLTAKEKLCKMDETNCNPDYCPYAKGYFDRINSSLKEIIKDYKNYNRETIEFLSEKYQLCPFELSLDLTLWSDIIVCDYNYVFDPKVYLKRFFEKPTDFTFLIDEAHNLVDRGRAMYSTTFSKKMVLDVKKLMIKKDKKISNSLNKINSFFVEKRKLLNFMEQHHLIEKDDPCDLYNLIRIFLERTDEYFAKSKEDNPELLELYFEAHSFLSIGEFYDDNYVTLYENTGDDITVTLYCINPSKVLKDKMSLGKSAIIFSATLLPLDYFKEILGAKKEDHLVNLSSPFDVNNRLLMIGDRISTTYAKREETSLEIVDYIYNCIKAKQGNYMVFLPSYRYMEMIFTLFREKHPNVDAEIQESNMSDSDKDLFLAKFHEGNIETHVGFCVLGGHFSEGIDLTSNRLIGVIIVGVGMPQICFERDIIKNHFDEDSSRGFEYAYVYPGMIKVLQAAGRCIRTEEDKGVILLLDTRYSRQNYEALFPKEWFNNIKVRNSSYVSKLCTDFWGNKNKSS